MHSLYISKKLTKQTQNLTKQIYKSWNMETIFINSENSKTNESHKFRLNLTDKLNLTDPKKIMALAN